MKNLILILVSLVILIGCATLGFGNFNDEQTEINTNGDLENTMQGNLQQYWEFQRFLQEFLAIARKKELSKCLQEQKYFQ